MNGFCVSINGAVGTVGGLGIETDRRGATSWTEGADTFPLVGEATPAIEGPLENCI